MAAPVGNKNGENGKRWRMAIDAALEERGADKWAALKQIANALLDKAQEGDMTAIKELGDRIDGKSAQPVALTDPDGGPLQITIKAYEIKPPQ